MKDLVYLIEAQGCERYKIGITTQSGLDRRVKALQTGNSDRLVVLKVIISIHASMIEKTMHRNHKSKNNSGEWFSLTIEDIYNFESECNKIIDGINVLVELGNPFIIKK